MFRNDANADVTSQIVHGPYGGKYDAMEFFPAMGTNWDKASRCLQVLLPDWLKTLMYGKLLSRNNVEILHQYEELAEAQRFVASQLEEKLNKLLNENSKVTVSAAYCKVKVNGIVSFGAMVNITQLTTVGLPLGRDFECFINFQNRNHWDIMDCPDPNDRTINDPAWLIASNRTRLNGHPEFPPAMRLDMMGQYCVENGWSAYQVLGQQLLLTVALVIKKGQ